MDFGDGERLRAGCGFENPVAVSAQDRAREIPDLLVVLDEQHRLGPAHRIGRAPHAFRGARAGPRARQVDLEHGALARFARDNHTAATLFDYAKHRREAKARALSLWLGGEERFE